MYGARFGFFVAIGFVALAAGPTRAAPAAVSTSVSAGQRTLPQPGRQFDASGRYQGRTDADGRVYDAQGRYQGRNDKDGRLYDAQGRVTGRVDSDGRRYDDQGRYQGRSDGEGRIYDTQGRYEGRVGADGRQYDAQGRYQGAYQRGDQPRDQGRSTGQFKGQTSPDLRQPAASASSTHAVNHTPAGAQAVQVENNRQIAPAMFCFAGDPSCDSRR